MDNEFKNSIKENITSAAAAALLTVIAVYAWRVLASLIMRSYVGSEAASALLFGQAIFTKNVMMLIPTAAIIYCIISIAFRRHVLIAVGITAAGSLLLGIICYLMQHAVSLAGGPISAVMYHGAKFTYVPADLMDFLRSSAAGFGVAFPVLLGGLCCAGYGRCIKSAIIVESVLTAIFIIVSIVFELLFAVVLQFGIFGASLGNVLSAVIIFVIAVFVSFLKRKQ